MGLWENISHMIWNSFLVVCDISFQGSDFHSFFCFGFMMRYFTFCTTCSRSIFRMVSTIYSRTCSLFHRWTEIRKFSISSTETESRELSKNFTVNMRNPVMMHPRITTAKAGFRLSMTHERRSPTRDPIPNVILFLARIVPYSLGSACDRTYP